MKSKPTACFLLTVVLSCVLVAEGNRDVNQEDRTIEWWTLSTGAGEHDPRTDLNRLIAGEFHEQHPHVNIEITPLHVEDFKKRIQIVVQADSPPDLFQSWGGYVMFEFARQNKLRDITYFVNSTLSKLISRESLAVYSYAGKFYGAPYDMGAVVVWYNRKIFEHAGVPVPQTWQDLLYAVRRIKDAGYVPIAMGGKDRWPAHFWWVYLAMRLGGKEAFDTAYGGTGSFTDPAFIQAGRLFKDLVATGPFQEGFENATYDQQAGLMGDGIAAMELMGQWAPSVAKNNATTGKGLPHLDVFPFPSVEGGKGDINDVMGGGNGYIVGKNAPDETLEFLEYFLSEGVQRRLIEDQGIIPVNKAAARGQTGPIATITGLITKATYYQLYYDQYFPFSVGEALNDASLLLLTGEYTPEETAAAINAAWREFK
ncbi:MAG: extracellular solute-binding protein [Spirochaetales bacterium]|nr:extracellular solute-binding protein [Spirochaetales bacterium]